MRRLLRDADMTPGFFSAGFIMERGKLRTNQPRLRVHEEKKTAIGTAEGPTWSVHGVGSSAPGTVCVPPHTTMATILDMTPAMAPAKNTTVIQSLFPIRFPTLMELFKEQQCALWVMEEGPILADRSAFLRLSEPEQHLLACVLQFFTVADGMILGDLPKALAADVNIPEATMFYAIQTYIEAVHLQTYSLMQDTLVRKLQSPRVAAAVAALDTLPSVQAKVAWAQKWLSPTSGLSVAHRIIGLMCFEGIAFQGAFCVVFWFKKRGLLPGLTFFNELISRDEALHTRFGAELYKALGGGLATEDIHTIIREAVQCEEAFVQEILPEALVGMDATAMVQYIKSVANYVCVKLLGISAPYPGVMNPFEWMSLLDTDGKANFFERTVSEYFLPSDVVKADQDARTRASDIDFSAHSADI